MVAIFDNSDNKWLEINKKMEDYSSLAVLNGIGLLSMEEKRIDLENYYMNLIESI